MWVKLGIRKLVSSDGKTATITEHESCIVRPHFNTITYSSNILGASNETVPINEEALQNPFVQFPASGAMEVDDLLDQSGIELLNAIEWDPDGEIQVPPKTTVSVGKSFQQFIYHNE